MLTFNAVPQNGQHVGQVPFIKNESAAVGLFSDGYRRAQEGRTDDVFVHVLDMSHLDSRFEKGPHLILAAYCFVALQQLDIRRREKLLQETIQKHQFIVTTTDTRHTEDGGSVIKTV